MKLALLAAIARFFEINGYFILTSVLRAAEPKSDYICAVNEYISETQKDSKLIKSIPVTKNKEGDHHAATPVMTGEGTRQVGWSITLDGCDLNIM
jgi:hypothetical protein